MGRTGRAGCVHSTVACGEKNVEEKETTTDAFSVAKRLSSGPVRFSAVPKDTVSGVTPVKDDETMALFCQAAQFYSSSVLT